MLRHFWILVPLLSFLTLIAYGQDDPQDIVAAVMAATEPEVIQSLPAPDGRLLAEVTAYPCVDLGEIVAAYERLELIHSETEERQLITEQVISCGGLGAAGLDAVRWSAQSIYLYYTEAREGQPDGLAAGWVPSLWRVQTDTLEVESLGQAQLSADAAWVALWDDMQISVMPADSRNRRDLPLVPEALNIQQVVWLPDTSGLIYIQADERFQSTRSTVTHIDLETMEQTVLLDSAEAKH